MAEELLDRPQVGASLQEVGRKGVPQPVRVGKEPPQRGGVERPSACGQKESVRGAASERRPSELQVAAQVEGGLLAQGDDPLLAPLPADADELLLEVHVGQRQVNDLLRTQARRVDELEQGPVADAECVVGLDLGEQSIGFVRLWRMRQAPPPPPRHRQIGDAARAVRRPDERADGRELACDRRLRQLPRVPPGAVRSQLGGERRESAGVESLEAEAVTAEPCGKLIEVPPVGPARGIGERLASQKAVDGEVRVHVAQFRLVPRLPSVQLRHRVRDLILASWETDADRVARTLPAGLEPATVDGRHLVTIAALRWDGGRLGYLPVPHFKQVNVRVYARHRDETAVVFLALRVSPLGLGAALLGFPVRPSRARVRDGIVTAKGFGIELRYERRAPAEPGELGSHELGLFEAAGLRELRIRRGEASWERAEAIGPVRADPLLALGFSVTAPPELLYAARTSFETELPAQRVGP